MLQLSTAVQPLALHKGEEKEAGGGNAREAHSCALRSPPSPRMCFNPASDQPFVLASLYTPMASQVRGEVARVLGHDAAFRPKLLNAQLQLSEPDSAAYVPGYFCTYPWYSGYPGPGYRALSLGARA
eukprot:3236201-Rhodomonas_salina.1